MEGDLNNGQWRLLNAETHCLRSSFSLFSESLLADAVPHLRHLLSPSHFSCFWRSMICPFMSNLEIETCMQNPVQTNNQSGQNKQPIKLKKSVVSCRSTSRSWYLTSSAPFFSSPFCTSRSQKSTVLSCLVVSIALGYDGDQHQHSMSLVQYDNKKMSALCRHTLKRQSPNIANMSAKDDMATPFTPAK